MHRVALRLTLATAALLGWAACTLVPGGIDAARLWTAQDDPVQLADLALDTSFTAALASRAIETALQAGDVELAQSFIELADERAAPLEPALRARVAAENTGPAMAVRSARLFAKGLVTGEPDDVASLAGTIAGDLFVFGDLRDVIRESARLARGEEADEVVLGLACMGLAVTAGTYASLGAAAPARAGLSLVKAAGKTGRITAEMSAALVRPLRAAVDGAALGRAFGTASLLQPALAMRTAREAVKMERMQGLVRLAGDMGKVQAKAGTRAALDGLRITQGPQDVSRLARLAEAKGSKTRAIVKLLGRGAIALTIGVFELASWMLFALINLLALCVTIKRAAEHAAQRIIDAGRLRRARGLLAQPKLAA
jgi:hypothetical protein